MKIPTLPEEITSLGIRKKLAKKQYLFTSGQEAAGFFYLISGEIRVFKMDRQAKEVEVVRIKPGDFFGEAAAFTSSCYPAYAEAVAESEVIFFNKQQFFQRLDKNPAVARFFIKLLAEKCLILNERIESLGLKTVRQRLAQYLLSRCSGQTGCLVEVRVKKSDLARLLGTVPETLSRTLKTFQEEGLIERHGWKIKIKNCPRLKQEIFC
ncbi:MAG: Crp/Fnr family transcriptional regulator [Candidatus Saccharicenans sp.]|nr:Crp/Fnr family transcriptional regulator [Candidatus Saccharicenans sp.]MDI6848820.1 Crp/Fnr family transcriptional regulator [Candidatus Saccharicenans sp.]